MFAVMLPPSPVVVPWFRVVSAFAWVLVAAFFSLPSLWRLARRRGWTFVTRLMPAILLAILLLMIAALESRAHARLAVYYAPYCEGWFYYIEPLCWGI